MAVPYTFGSATSSIPLSQLDSNFATAITLGNTAVQLGNTITTLTGVTNVASSGSLTLGTSGNTTAITIDTSQNVGIGITPSAWGSTTKNIQVNASALTCLNSTNTYLTHNAYINSSSQNIYINSDFASLYRQNSGTHYWYTAPTGTAGGVISYTQSLAVGKGTTLALEGATSATGIGITFPSTQSASTNANTLDDYEEGTWTPTDTSGAGLSFTINSARYIKIGTLVYVQSFFNFPTTSNGSIMQFGGLPFAVAGGGTYGTTVARCSNISAMQFVQPQDGSTNMSLYTGGVAQPINSANSGGYVVLTCCYNSAS